MTGQEVYEAALSVLCQNIGDNEKWDRMALPWLHMAMNEALPTENSLRQAQGIAPLETAAKPRNLEEKLKVSDKLFMALVNALAAQLESDAGESYKAQDYRARFAGELRDALVSVPESVVEVYG